MHYTTCSINNDCEGHALLTQETLILRVARTIICTEPKWQQDKMAASPSRHDRQRRSGGGQKELASGATLKLCWRRVLTRAYPYIRSP